MQPLQDVLDECGFMDMGFVGSQCTWHKHFVDYTVREQLDRAVATNDWFAMFPLWIVPEGMDCTMQKPFQFEQMWMTDEGCGRIVKAVWMERSNDPGDIRVLKKVEKCEKELTNWSRKNFGSVKREVEKNRKLLVQTKRLAIQSGDTTRMKQIEGNINTSLDKEAKMWAQRSWVMWLKDGDKNTFFS